MTARRLVLTPGELALLADRLELPLPAGFEVSGGSGSTERLAALGVLRDGAVHPSVAAGLAAACAPRLAVHVEAERQDGQVAVQVTAALGVREEVGGGLVRTGTGGVEASLWPAVDLGRELARLVPPDGGTGSLRAAVLTPPDVVGQAVWLATAEGWHALEPGGTSRRVGPADLGPALAPLVAAALP